MINRSCCGINDRIVVVVIRVIADFPVPAEFAHGTGLRIAVQVGNGNDHIAEGSTVVDAVIGITRIPQCDRCTDHRFNILIAFRDDIGQRIHIKGRGIAFAVGHGNTVEGHTADGAAGCGIGARCCRTLERERGIAYGIVRLLQFGVGGRERIADRGRGQDLGPAGERQIVIGPGKDDLHFFRAVKIIGHGSGGGIDHTGPADCAVEGEIAGGTERRIGCEVAIDHDRTGKRLGAFTGQGQVAVSTGKDFLCAVAIVAHIAPGGTVEGAGEGAGEGDRAVVGEGSGSEVAIHIKGCRFADGGGIGSNRTGSSGSAGGFDHQIRVCPGADLLICIAVICHFPVVFSSGSKIAADSDPADVCQGCSGNISCNDQCAADRICDTDCLSSSFGTITEISFAGKGINRIRSNRSRACNREVTHNVQCHTITNCKYLCCYISGCSQTAGIGGIGPSRRLRIAPIQILRCGDSVCKYISIPSFFQEFSRQDREFSIGSCLNGGGRKRNKFTAFIVSEYSVGNITQIVILCGAELILFAVKEEFPAVFQSSYFEIIKGCKNCIFRDRNMTTNKIDFRLDCRSIDFLVIVMPIVA